MNNIIDFVKDFQYDVLITHSLRTIMFIVSGFIVTGFITKAIDRTSNRKYADDKKVITLVRLLKSMIRYIISFIILLLILEEFGLPTKAILGSAGVLGLAVGFGAQDLVKDFISGFFIIFEQQFHVGDVIEVDSFKGNVTSLGFKTTRIQNWKGEVKVISNGSIKNIVNYSLNNSIAIIDFSVDYTTNLEEFGNKLVVELETLPGKYEGLRSTPNYLGVQKLNDSGIDLRVIVETNPMEHFGIERSLRQHIKTFCDQENISIPFPQMVIHND